MRYIKLRLTCLTYLLVTWRPAEFNRTVDVGYQLMRQLNQYSYVVRLHCKT